jgi:polyisoprenoid-binding protein YceI
LSLRNTLAWAAAAFAFAVPASVPAQEIVLVLDPAQTRIEYTLPEVLRTMHGTFRLKSGTIHFDPATGKAGGLVVVDVTSEHSDNVSLDRKIQKDVLETRKYPEATFTPIQIDGRLAGQGESPLQLSGTLKVHRIEHDLMVATTVTKSGDRFSASTHFLIPYVDWGLKNPGGLLLRVGNQIEFNIETVGRFTLPTGAR